MKRKYLLLILVLFVTGCSAEYNLKISNNTFKETINFTVENEVNQQVTQGDIEQDDQLTPFLEEKTSSLITNDKFYKKKVKNIDNYTQVEMKYNYDEEEFKNSNSINLCFEYPDLDFSDNYYIHLQGEFYCLYGDSIDIKIETNNKVYSNNADEVLGNVYIWHINQDNQDYVDIQIDIDKGISNSNILVIVVGILVFIGLCVITYIFIQKRKDKDNI